jgi:hypothetical protein
MERSGVKNLALNRTSAGVGTRTRTSQARFFVRLFTAKKRLPQNDKVTKSVNGYEKFNVVGIVKIPFSPKKGFLAKSTTVKRNQCSRRRETSATCW